MNISSSRDNEVKLLVIKLTFATNSVAAGIQFSKNIFSSQHLEIMTNKIREMMIKLCSVSHNMQYPHNWEVYTTIYLLNAYQNITWRL